MNRYMFIVLTSFAIQGCTWASWHKDFVTPPEKLNPPKLHLLSLGMSKPEVVGVIGEPDQVTGAKTEEERLIETWEYTRIEAVPGPDRIAERYQVFFTNGKLSGYEAAGDFKQQVNVR